MLIQKNDIHKFQKAKILKDLNSLKGFRLGVNRGNWYGEDFEKLKEDPLYKNIIKETTKEIQLYKMLKKKRLSGILVDKYSGFSFLKKLNYGKSIIQHPIKIYSDDIFVMFSKKSVKKSFVRRFNLNLQKIKESGQYQKILKKYIQ